MGIIFLCDQCKKRYEVDESFAGKRAKCKGCGAPMLIPASGPPVRPASASASRRPSAPARDDPADRFGLDDVAHAPKEEVLLSRGGASRRPAAASAASSGVPPWVWLVSGGVGLLVVVLIVALLFSGSSKNKPVAQGTTAPGGDPAQEADAPPPPPPPQTEATGKFVRDDVSAAVTQSSWRVKVDPAPEKVEFPPLAKLSIPIPESYGGDSLLYPTTPSAFVIMGGNDADQQYREVVDLRTATKIGRLGGRIEAAKPMALSPDGAYFVVHTNPVPRTTDVWRVADAKRIGRIQDGKDIPDFIDFAGPNRLLIGTSYAKTFQVWDFQTGAVVFQFSTPERFDRDSIAFSPGRGYVAMTIASRNKLQVYHLTNGKLAGEYELSKDGIYDLDCQGMAFSSDGSALTGLFDVVGQFAHVMTWDVATGKLESDFRTEGPNPYGKTFAYTGQVVQWLPDQSGWLIFDQAIVERKSGQVVWTLPFDQARNHVEAPRKLLDFERLIAEVKVRDRKTLQLVSIPKDKILAAIAAAKGGGSVVDVVLPPAKTGDLGAAKKIAASAGRAVWAAAPDPAPASKAKLVRSMTLKASALDLLDLRFSAPASAQAIVTSSPGARLKTNVKGQQGQQARQVDRYDLTSGRALGRLELPSVSLPIAFSPDATQVLVGHSGAPDRLDLYAAAGGKHLVGWRPYDKESGDARKVVWADFLGAGQVLTVNESGTLILWSVPDCKAVYVAEKATQGAPILSPGRKSLAALGGGGLKLIDPATGSVQGATADSGLDAETGLKAAAFRPDGKELAAVVGDTIARWDLKSGKSLEPITSPVPKATALQYAGDSHLLIDNKMLFDLDRKRPVWYFEGGLHATASPDGSHWYAAGAIGSPAALVGIELPGKDVASAEAAANDPKTKAMLRAGSKVSIQVAGNPPRDAEGFRRDLVNGLAARLQAVGAEAADGQPVKLAANFQETNTGRTMELKMFGGNRTTPETRPIADRNLEWTLSLVDDQGPPIVLARATVGLGGFGLQQIPAGENDWEGYLRNQQWRSAAGQCAARGLPFFAARRAGGGAVLPGLSNLGHPQF